MPTVRMHCAAHNSKWLLLVLCMLFSAFIQPRAVVHATEDVMNLSACQLESIINQLVNPSPEYQLHASALRNQLKNILRDRQLNVGDEQNLGDYSDYVDEDKRSVAALAAHPGLKRSLATLAKNGQLPNSPEPADYNDEASAASAGENSDLSEQKRYIGSLARSGGILSAGKRNVGTLARDFQLPTGKRNLATMARLGMLGSPNREPKRNLAAVARYNSQQHRGGASAAAAEKRNLGALKSSPVHGAQQKREDEQLLLAPPMAPRVAYDMDYLGDGLGGGEAALVASPNYWLYPSYADLDWGDFGRAQKRFLDTSKDPELFGIEHAQPMQQYMPEYIPEILDTKLSAELNDDDNRDDVAFDAAQQILAPPQQKRHIGAVYRSGFLPSYRFLRSTTGSNMSPNGRFSRSGRARQFVEYYPQHERLRQPTAAVCKRCFLPNRPMINWSNAGIRRRLPKFSNEADSVRSISTNALPTGGKYGRPAKPTTTTFHTWGTPPRITALHRREFRRNDEPMDNYEY